MTRSFQRLRTALLGMYLPLCALACGGARSSSQPSTAPHVPRPDSSRPSATSEVKSEHELEPREAHVCAADDLTDCKAQCELGNAASCTFLAYHYLDGKGVAKDAIQAIRLLHRACTNNDAAGCASLAYALREGTGGRRNLPKSVEYDTKACQLGSAPGCTSLGVALSQGEGTDRDTGRALAMYSKGCELGDGLGCFNAGQMHAEGTGNSTNESEAAGFYRAGCDLDDPSACTQLAFYSAKGIGGVPKDEPQARVLFERACNAGEETACTNLRVMASETAKAPKRLQAEQSLPPLFADCLANRAKVEALRVEGVRAARNGDKNAANRATKKLRQLEPTWSETLDKIAAAIDEVAVMPDGGRDETRYATLMRRFHQCSCEPTPSGRCRR